VRALIRAQQVMTSITMQAETELDELFTSHKLPKPRLAMRSESALMSIISLAYTDLLAMVPPRAFDITAQTLAPIKRERRCRPPGNDKTRPSTAYPGGRIFLRFALPAKRPNHASGKRLSIRRKSDSVFPQGNPSSDTVIGSMRSICHPTDGHVSRKKRREIERLGGSWVLRALLSTE
jgi:hypothetical protein